MGQLVDLIDSKAFRKHTALCIGTYEFSGVGWFLGGYSRAICDASPDAPDDMFGFREWLHQRFDGAGNVGWVALIQEQFGVGEEATNQFFVLFDQFRSEVESRGIEKIIQEHAEYELRRYGALASSTLRPGALRRSTDI